MSSIVILLAHVTVSKFCMQRLPSAAHIAPIFLTIVDVSSLSRDAFVKFICILSIMTRLYGQVFYFGACDVDLTVVVALMEWWLHW